MPTESSYGVELSADWDVTRTLRVGGNYTYIERDFDYREALAADHSLRHGTTQARPKSRRQPPTRPEGTPRSQGIPLPVLAGDAPVDPDAEP